MRFLTYNFSPQRRGGFTLLFAVLVGSLLFSMGVAVANLALKELAFSSAGKSSEIAFYTADAGVECALYWDLREVGTFPNSETAESRSEITCNENTIPVTVDQKTATAAVSNFTMAFGSGCAAVTVIKTKPQGKTAGTVVIESRGRNDCGTENNPARVERALRARY